MVEVTRPDAPAEAQQRREVLLHLRVWEVLNPGVSVTAARARIHPAQNTHLGSVGRCWRGPIPRSGTQRAWKVLIACRVVARVVAVARRPNAT